MGDAGDIQVVVATRPDEGNSRRDAAASPESGDLDPTGLGDCGRSIVSYASSSIRRSTISYQQRQRRAQWKGIGSRCMWDACRASLFGLLLLLTGCIIVLVGFYTEFSSIEAAVNFNQSLFLVDPTSQKRRKISYSYIGPVLIGIGVFVLIGVVVATMEMRDMTAKVFPLTKRTYPRRRRKGSQSKSKLTAEVVGEMFQTPTQRIMKEMSALNRKQERQMSFRTTGTQTFQPRSWLWTRLKSPRCAFNFHGKVWRSCQQLTTPNNQQSVILPTSVFKRRRRHRCQRRLLIHSLAESLAVSCPQLDSVS